MSKKRLMMIRTLRRHLENLGFDKQQYTILLKQKYIELQLQNNDAVNYILNADNEHDFSFTQHSKKPILIITWKNE